MKILLFVLLTFPFLIPSNMEVHKNDYTSNEIKLTINTDNGAITEFVDISNLKERTNFYENSNLVIYDCSYEATNGDCRVEAGNCEAARQLFIDCMCEKGYPLPECNLGGLPGV